MTFPHNCSTSAKTIADDRRVDSTALMHGILTTQAHRESSFTVLKVDWGRCSILIVERIGDLFLSGSLQES